MKPPAVPSPPAWLSSLLEQRRQEKAASCSASSSLLQSKSLRAATSSLAVPNAALPPAEDGPVGSRPEERRLDRLEAAQQRERQRLDEYLNGRMQRDFGTTESTIVGTSAAESEGGFHSSAADRWAEKEETADESFGRATSQRNELYCQEENARLGLSGPANVSNVVAKTYAATLEREMARVAEFRERALRSIDNGPLLRARQEREDSAASTRSEKESAGQSMLLERDGADEHAYRGAWAEDNAQEGAALSMDQGVDASVEPRSGPSPGWAGGVPEDDRSDGLSKGCRSMGQAGGSEVGASARVPHEAATPDRSLSHGSVSSSDLEDDDVPYDDLSDGALEDLAAHGNARAGRAIARRRAAERRRRVEARRTASERKRLRLKNEPRPWGVAPRSTMASQKREEILEKRRQRASVEAQRPAKSLGRSSGPEAASRGLRRTSLSAPRSAPSSPRSKRVAAAAGMKLAKERARRIRREKALKREEEEDRRKKTADRLRRLREESAAARRKAAAAGASKREKYARARVAERPAEEASRDPPEASAAARPSPVKLSKEEALRRAAERIRVAKKKEKQRRRAEEERERRKKFQKRDERIFLFQQRQALRAKVGRKGQGKGKSKASGPRRGRDPVRGRSVDVARAAEPFSAPPVGSASSDRLIGAAAGCRSVTARDFQRMLMGKASAQAGVGRAGGRKSAVGDLLSASMVDISEFERLESEMSSAQSPSTPLLFPRGPQPVGAPQGATPLLSAKEERGSHVDLGRSPAMPGDGLLGPSPKMRGRGRSRSVLGKEKGP